MNKIELILNVAQLVLQVVKDMRQLSDSVQKVCDTVMEGLSEEEQPKAIEQKPTKKAEPDISLEKVRGVLAQKSQEGFTAEVKSLIQKFGANRLSEIDPKDFKAVLEEAEGLGNG